MSDEVTHCPECGAIMYRRLAKRGINAGRYFYGCSHYPTCRGVREIQNTTSPDLPNYVSVVQPRLTGQCHVDLGSINYPTPLIACPRADDLEPLFMDTLALPAHLLMEASGEASEISRKELLEYAKWRLDIPKVTTYQNKISKSQRTILSILARIIWRGRLTRLSPDLEKELGGIFETTSSFQLSRIINSYEQYSLPNLPNWEHNKPSQANLAGMSAEEYFFKRILVATITPEHLKNVISQVSCESLVNVSVRPVDRPLLKQWADFVVSRGDKIMVIQLDSETRRPLVDSSQRLDELLKRSGYEVFRIKVDNSPDLNSPDVQRVIVRLKQLFPDKINKQIAPDLSLIAHKFVHQVQSTILATSMKGVIPIDQPTKMAFLCGNVPLLAPKLQSKLVKLAVADLQGLAKHVAAIYGVANPLVNIAAVATTKIDMTADFYVSGKDLSEVPPAKVIYIQDAYFSLPTDMSLWQTWPSQKLLTMPSKTRADLMRVADNLAYIFKYVFRHDQFRENQLDGIMYGLRQEDAIVLLPTGSGKSAIFQLLSLILPGICLVVAPLTSLIEDQVDNLVKIGIDRVAGITSNTTYRQCVEQAIVRGQYLLVYVSPERFQIEEFRRAIRSYCTCGRISLCAIDEAHCVSEWGHDFRVSYLNLANTIRRMTVTKSGRATIIALTGTASDAVLNDMVRDLDIPQGNIVQPTTFDRPELHFRIIVSSSEDKRYVLEELLTETIPDQFAKSLLDFYFPIGSKTQCGVVFCPHVGGAFGVLEVLKQIQDICLPGGNTIPVCEYYGSQTDRTKRMDAAAWEATKRRNAKNFKNNKCTVLVATKSFGMGIDKPNVRFTINYCLPQSIEEFYQEAGRGGRDGQSAYNYLIASNDYPSRNQKLLSSDVSIKQILSSSDMTDRGKDDDITRVLYFHGKAYAGVEGDKQAVREILGQLDFTKDRQTITATDREIAEKAIHRLVILGVVDDYAINFVSNEFIVIINQQFDQSLLRAKYAEYVSGYQSDENFIKSKVGQLDCISADNETDFIVEAVGVLLNDFIYDTVEKSRRTTIRNLLAIVNDAKDLTGKKQEDLIRRELLDFLSTSYAEDISAINSNPRDFNLPQQLVDRVGHNKNKLQAQINRSLQSHPDSPALLLARLACLVGTPKRRSTLDLTDIKQLVNEITDYALGIYAVEPEVVVKGLIWALSPLTTNHRSDYIQIITMLAGNSVLTLPLLKYLSSEFQYIPYLFMANGLVSELLGKIISKEV